MRCQFTPDAEGSTFCIVDLPVALETQPFELAIYSRGRRLSLLRFQIIDDAGGLAFFVSGVSLRLRVEAMAADTTSCVLNAAQAGD